jgi:hypothetical protein
VTPLTLASSSTRVEAEAEWPPLVVDSAFAFPSFPPCASASRALYLHPLPGSEARIRLSLPVREPGPARLRTYWVLPASGRIAAAVSVGGASFRIELRGSPGQCASAEGPPVDLPANGTVVEITTRSEALIDALEPYK